MAHHTRRTQRQGRSSVFSVNFLALTLSAVLILKTVNVPGVTSFIVSKPYQRHHRQFSATQLSAKKASSRNKKSKITKDMSSSSGGGFAAQRTTTTSSSSSSTTQHKQQQKQQDQSQSLQGKVRTVSGFSGSGTKPLRQAANTFDQIRAKYGKDVCWDVYCKSPLDDPNRLWFVGKVAVVPDTVATPEQAVISQKRIILEYAKRELRPQNLGLPQYSNTLELWLAPGDSEMECVQNKVSLWPVKGSVADLVSDFSVDQVGYNPEIYVGDEREKGGLRITRDDDGHPIKPVFDINL